MWKLYDDLLALIPADLRVEECLIGLYWTLVRSETIGLAMTPLEGSRTVTLSGKMAGMPVRELAEYVKSWNLHEAALGLAALNSVLNIRGRVEKLRYRLWDDSPKIGAFDYFQESFRGKKVAAIGHLPGVERFADCCQLSVLERRLQPGDYPDPACEYLLPEQDFVFITATSLENKTLPRLLELCPQAFTVVWGPSTPLAPLLFDYGVDVLWGTMVVEPGMVRNLVGEGGMAVDFKPYAPSVMITRG
ncbi:DUF364 domain-containing protein [Desulfosporosinus sp. PR]|uniref:DUF364 domain-containing protein n=1 Tax=Candidatus Desulfosporosinus nitrosoreducens TaxID=3401928 RepID=UPI0027E97A3B|nr:DUF364 domain-containing protein [Desulfosporosinus sp. PR]MDQ7095673.1 DUF364 domain-containing protein [Desulfosporosinus sp. PR]